MLILWVIIHPRLNSNLKLSQFRLNLAALSALYPYTIFVKQRQIPLINRVYGKLRTDFFPSINGPSATVRTEKTRLRRCLLYGFSQFGGTETGAGRAN